MFQSLNSKLIKDIERLQYFQPHQQFHIPRPRPAVRPVSPWLRQPRCTAATVSSPGTACPGTRPAAGARAGDRSGHAPPHYRSTCCTPDNGEYKHLLIYIYLGVFTCCTPDNGKYKHLLNIYLIGSVFFYIYSLLLYLLHNM